MSEFSEKYKLMTINAITEQTLRNDASAVLRQVAVTYPEGMRWKQSRSYMLVDQVKRQGAQVKVSGYIRNNLLCAKRLLQMTGSKAVFKIDSIALGQDPCPLKISQQHKEKIMSSKAASKMTSKMSSRAGSRKGSMNDSEPTTNKPGRVIQQLADPKERD